MQRDELGRRYVIVTGGTGSIGRTLVKNIAAQGYDVVFTHRDDQAAATLTQALAGHGYDVHGYRCDLADSREIQAFCEQCEAKHGVPHGLVCSAGVKADALSFQIQIGTVRDVFQVNLFSAIQLAGYFARPMGRKQGGRIVFVSSIASAMGNRGNGVYAASKGGLESYMRSIVEEFARRGVTVNCVLPGFVDTPMGQEYGEWAERVMARIPARRFASADDVAHVVGFLLSDGAGYVHGVCLPVDGGVTATLGLT
jgi:NAD(P)-dependent dehydrogenase (short-subunit alcohol dehydrogenase family)